MKMKKMTTLLMVVLTLAMGTATASALQMTLYPIGDTYTSSYYGTTNYGTENEIHHEAGDSGHWHAWYKYDISALDGMTVTDATMTVTYSGSQANVTNYTATLHVYTSSDAWDETTLTYYGTYGHPGSEQTLNSSIVVNKWEAIGTSYTSTSTDSGAEFATKLNEDLHTDNEFSIALFADANWYRRMNTYSREGAPTQGDQAYLTIDYIPEPATALMLALGGLCVRIRRRQ
jgi:hypothetical protein